MGFVIDQDHVSLSDYRPIHDALRTLAAGRDPRELNCPALGWFVLAALLAGFLKIELRLGPISADEVELDIVVDCFVQSRSCSTIPANNFSRPAAHQ